MKLGLRVSTSDFDRGLALVRELGFHSCQLACGRGQALTQALARELVEKLAAAGVTVSSVWPIYPVEGGMEWRYRREGPPTVGLVPPETRAVRKSHFERASDFAAWLGCPNVAQHVGYVPEDPSHPLYDGFLNDMGDLLDYCYRNDGQWFLFETGQETPPALLRLFQDLGRPNVGVNYDTGNLILYGKANPVDGIEMIGRYVRDVHAKDGEYPTDGYALGKEVPLGEGKVDFAAVIAKLKALDYNGAITIECELHGDVRPALWQAKRLLEPLLT